MSGILLHVTAITARRTMQLQYASSGQPSRSGYRFTRFAGAMLLAAHAALSSVSSQEVIVTTPDGQTVVTKLQVEGAPAATPQGVTPDGQPVPGKPEGGPPPNGKNRKPGENPMPGAEPPKSETPPVVQRPAATVVRANPEELNVKLDENGKVRINFRGQPWVDVLNWLADVSSMSLDWQELPGDALNLTTQRAFKLDELRDLINRHLLTRGFTLLQDEGTLTVVNIKKIDAGMVPRVEPGELKTRMPYEFVKVSLPLEWLVAEGAVEELKPLLSPNGKLTSLKSTNRLEAMDSVINLRDLYKVIGQEQSDDQQERLVREFELHYAKATEVQQQLQKLLGVDEKSSGSGGRGGQSPEQMQQMMQQQQQEMMMAMQQQQMQQQQGRGGGAPQRAGAKPIISLVVNNRRNSILALAPPDKMAIIAQTVKIIDVPPEHSQTLIGNVNRMQVHRLSGIDPGPLVRMLEDGGGLEPTTRLQIDEKNKAIVVYATLADHMMIRAVIKKLDGSGRKFEVIQLRRLEAEYVAGTIEFMMSGGGEDKQQNQRRMYFDFYDSYPRRNQAEQSTDKFKVDADVENNRLLLWANNIELEEVMNLMAKLGEVPDQRGKSTTVRSIEVEPGESTRELLERLRQAWPNIAPNRLELPALPKSPVKMKPRDATEQSEPERTPAKGSTPRRAAAAMTTPEKTTPEKVQFIAAPPTVESAVESSDSTPSGSEATAPEPVGDAEPVEMEVERQERPDNSLPDMPAAEAAPVKITVTPDGRLLFSSSDTRALDLLEELAENLAPPKRDYEVFKLKNAPAYWVKMNIKDYFEDQDKKDSSRSRSFFFDYSPPSQKDSRSRLSKRKPLKLISDLDTNTILVQGADAVQLRIIRELIELYDQPEPTNAKSARITTLYKVRWSKAQVLAEAVMEVYRDLLSSNDKALQQQQGAGGEQRGRTQSSTTYIFGGEESNERDKKTPVSFKGKLSFGVDELSNTILISADGETLTKNVVMMLQSLDKASQPTSTVEVLHLKGGLNAEKVKKSLTEMFGEKKPAANPQNPQEQNPNGQEPGRPGVQRGRNRQPDQ